jgi:hypothetical protein
MEVSDALRAKAEREAARHRPKARQQMPKLERADVLRRRAARKGHIIDRQGAVALMPEEVA